MTVSKADCGPHQACPHLHVIPVQWIILRTEAWSRYGIPLAPVIANLYMEYFEKQAIRSAHQRRSRPVGKNTWVTRLWYGPMGRMSYRCSWNT